MRLNRNKIITTVFFVLICNYINAQSLTLKAAVDSALMNNLGVQITKNYAEISENNNSAGNAGMLPSVDIAGGSTYAKTSIRQETSAGGVTDKTGVTNKTLNGSIALTWTIFDGARMFATKNKLELLQKQGELNVKQEIISTIASVSQAYFDLVRQQTLLNKTREVIGYYEERKRLADTKLSLGSAARTELLQATVDYNSELSNIEQQKIYVAAARIRLNELLVKPVDDSIVAADSLVIAETGLTYGSLVSKIESGNLDLQEQLLLQDIAKQELKETRSGRFPVIDVNAGYNFNRSTTSQGFFLENQSSGPNAGIGLRWNLFNGFVTSNQVKNAKLMEENAKLNAENIHQQAMAALATAWQNYAGALTIVKQQQESEKMASDNLDIMMKRFRLNESNVLELREAQRSLEDVQVRLANAVYDANIAAMSLKQLTGMLIE